jgi:hypothetical protein
MPRIAWLVFGLGSATVIRGLPWLVEAAAGDREMSLWFGFWLAALSLAEYAAVVVSFLSLEHRILGPRLGEEVELGTVPSWVTDVIPYYRRRVRSHWWPLRRERTVLARLLSRLAFRKHALARLTADEARLAGLEIVQLRNRIRRMLEPPVGDE